jgi:23S rRNA (cytidine1920-2'-O)/16S rRNA (cytidine1409-2'-O)-methyltransferase
VAKGKKIRLDVLLVDLGLAESRTKAQALVRAGEVTVDGQLHDKPGMSVRADADISVREPMPYVSRGGYKLAAALDQFDVDPSDLTCLDVGSSTGGFTDVLLQRGAELVYAVDVGRGQLAWRLRGDERVVSMERTDVRSIDNLPRAIHLAVVDVAFISLRRVLPPVGRLLNDDGLVIALVKPQFEAGRDQVGRGGIVRDPDVHRQVLADLAEWAGESEWRVAGAAASPITGSSGNREFLVMLAMPGAQVDAMTREDAVAAALA